MSYLEQISLADHRRLLNVAQRITAQKDIAALCETILTEAQNLTCADGGTLYLLKDQGQAAVLEFAIVRNLSLGLKYGGKGAGPASFAAIPMYQNGEPNRHNIATYAAHLGQLVNIADAYQASEFDFSGTRKLDQQLGYRTRSVLCLPLKTESGELVGVLQLLNAIQQGQASTFAVQQHAVLQALASFAAIALQQQRKVQEQKELLIALAGEPNAALLLNRILDEAQSITNADGGTLYLLQDCGQQARLEFSLLRNQSLGIRLDARQIKEQGLPPIALYLEDGSENHQHIAAHAALTKQTINIVDAYHDDSFDFVGTREFDAQYRYKSVSFLTVPLLNHTDDVIGVLQLVNARDSKDGTTIAFAASLQPLINALAKYAAIALNNLLLVDEHKKLLDAFIRVIAQAIDAKSPHTSGHCQKVPLLAELLTRALCADDGVFADFRFDDDQWYELRVAAWLHDCGKLATPDSILDKATKLHTLHDRIEMIAARYASLRQQLSAEFWQRQASDAGVIQDHAQLQQQLAQLDDELEFLRRVNQGAEFLAPEHKQRIHSIASRQWLDAKGQPQPMLSPDEVYNLSVERGTLTAEERGKINDHIVVTNQMLASLPFPRKLQRVPEYAGNHHERIDGSGFPNGLTGEQMSIPARVLAIADIFEALTASDRPYKQPMKISQALSILRRMRDDRHIDPDLYHVFLTARVWEQYADKVLKPEQLDAVDIQQFL